jgi:hypothetical protein
MSTPQTNFGLNNNARMGKLIPKIERIFGHVLVYSLIIFTTLSAVFGGVVVYPIYFVFYIFNKMKASNGIDASTNGIDASANGIDANGIDANEIEEEQFMNPIIDETWCNVSVKNIINYKDEEEEEEILSLKMPSNEEESEDEEEESEDEAEYDDSDDDRYSCRYKSGL